MENKAVDLSLYRMQNAKDTLKVAGVCLEQKFYKDTIKRCYYAAFSAVKAVITMIFIWHLQVMRQNSLKLQK